MFNTSWRSAHASREPTGQVIRWGVGVLSLTLAIVAGNIGEVYSTPAVGSENAAQMALHDDSATLEPASELQKYNAKTRKNAVSASPELPALTDLHGDPLPAGVVGNLQKSNTRRPRTLESRRLALRIVRFTAR